MVPLPRSALRRALTALVLVVCAACPRTSSASPPLLGVEARVGGGLAAGGTDRASRWMVAPITVSALVEYAIMDAPRVHLYGELIYEGMKRAGFGVALGLRFRPFDNGTRVGLGMIGMLTSYTHGGVAATVGQCLPYRGVRACLDLQGEAFFFGSDLPPNGVDGALKLVLSVGFDAL